MVARNSCFPRNRLLSFRNQEETCAPLSATLLISQPKPSGASLNLQEVGGCKHQWRRTTTCGTCVNVNLTCVSRVVLIVVISATSGGSSALLLRAQLLLGRGPDQIRLACIVRETSASFLPSFTYAFLLN